MVGRGPDETPQVMEVDADGQLAGVSEIDTKVDTIITGISTISTHVPQFGGEIWYVSAGASAGGDGTTPDTPFATITEAVTAAAAGAAINVRAGTYAENVDMNLVSLELWCEIGTVISPVSGIPLTVSGNYCKVKGDLDINVPAAQTGLLVSGDYCNICCGTILYGAKGVHVTGAGCTLADMAVGFQTSISYDIDGIQARLFECHTVGSGVTIGFNIGNAADTGVLRGCTSTGHQTAGFYIEAGCQDWTLLNCASGAGDGRWVDVDNANVWSNFTFDDEVWHLTTFVGGGGGQDNLFKITGAVEIQFIYGHVETILSADVDNIYLDLWDGTVSVDITDNAGTDTASADVGSLFVKTQDASVVIAMLKSDQGRVQENTNFRKPLTPFILNQKKDTNTYIRLVYSGVATSGAIHWHCQWAPLVGAAFVEAV